MAEQQNQPSVELNQTFNHTIENYTFGNLPHETCIEILKDGRSFSHFIEPWLAHNYPLIHVQGCKAYDFKDKIHPEILKEMSDMGVLASGTYLDRCKVKS